MMNNAHYESTLEHLITEHLSDTGWHLGDKSSYDRGVGLDRIELFKFIESTQKFEFERLLNYTEMQRKQNLTSWSDSQMN